MGHMVYYIMYVCVVREACVDVGVELTLLRGTESSCSRVIPSEAGLASRKERKALNEESVVREVRVWGGGRRREEREGGKGEREKGGERKRERVL